MRKENIQLSVCREKAAPYVQEKNIWKELCPFPESTSPSLSLSWFILSQLIELAQELGKKEEASSFPVASPAWEPPEGQREMEAIFVSLWWQEHWVTREWNVFLV